MATDAPPPRANPALFGHARAEAALARALRSGRLPHGWLLAGPRGVGKATLAYRFARALLVGGPGGDDLALDPLHPVFRQVAQGAHPDLRTLEPAREGAGPAGRAEIPIAAVRETIAALRATAMAGGRRVLLVDAADQLNRNAANALLKLLEEPPAGVVLLLVAHRAGRVSATIRSRCAQLRLRPLAASLVEEGLGRLAPGLAAADRRIAAALAAGSIGRALRLVHLGFAALYARVLEGVAGEGADTLGRIELAEELARLAEARGLALVVEVLEEVVRRGVDHGLGRPPAPALCADEAALLARLVAGRPLDRLGALWDNLARLAGRVDGLNLDRTQALLHMLTSLAPAARA